MSAALRAPARESTVRCHIVAFAVARAGADTIAQWRKTPIDVGGQILSASFLKHAEDQTVLATHAVLDVIAKEGWRQRSFTDWGVLAASKFFGRVLNAQTLERYRAEGSWGVSPHLIPHQSLHAVSGTISQLLKIHGPNLGVGGGPNACPDVMLLALTMLADGALPGLWLVMTGHERECIPAPGTAVAPPACHGVALALTPVTHGKSAPYLAIDHAPASASSSALYPDFDLPSFLDGLAGGAGQWRLSDSHWLEFATESPA